jgi:hypothetical protein
VGKSRRHRPRRIPGAAEERRAAAVGFVPLCACDGRREPAAGCPWLPTDRPGFTLPDISPISSAQLQPPEPTGSSQLRDNRAPTAWRDFRAGYVAVG